ncbi:MAG: VanZ family protein [Candidatus Cloacimonas sp.]|nr:VanZ family protein [Candidatus Cloacimonas sp.]
MISNIGFAWIYVLGVVMYKPVFKHNLIAKFITVMALAAIGFEGLQWFLPYRSFNPIDMGYNLLGGFLAVGVILVSRRFSHMKSAD